MTDSRSTQPSKPRSRGNGLAWKSGLLASSVGGLLLGWALLGQMEAAPNNSAASISPPEPRVIVVQITVPAPAISGIQQPVGQALLPERTTVQAGGQAVPVSGTSTAVQAQVAVPSMPQKPVFQQPVTRTRGS
jgi:hypothetical protein